MVRIDCYLSCRQAVRQLSHSAVSGVEKEGGRMDRDTLLAASLKSHREGDLTGAREGYRQLLDSDPDDADAIRLLGIAALQGGDLAMAKELLERAVDLTPESIPALYNLGLTYRQMRSFERSEQAFRRLLTFDPDHVGALGNLANLQLQSGKIREADVIYRRALRLSPDTPEFLANHGLCLAALGQPDQAVRSLERAVRRQPNDPAFAAALGRTTHRLGPQQDVGVWARLALRSPSGPVHLQHSRALKRAGATEAAYNAALRAAGLMRGNEAGQLTCARLALELGRPHDARMHARNAARISGGSAESLFMTGMSLSHLRRPAQALAAFREAIRIEPSHDEARVALASLLANDGLTDESDAVASEIVDQQAWAGALKAMRVTALEKSRRGAGVDLLRDTLIRERPSATLALAFANVAKSEEEREEALGYLRRCPRTSGNELTVRFAVAGLLDKLGRYDEAWEELLHANAKYALPYDARREEEHLASVRRSLDADYLRASPDSGHAGRPIFIVGMPRSGTSMTEQMLDRHSRLTGVGESGAIDWAFAQASSLLAGGLQYPTLARAVGARELEMMAKSYLQQVHSAALSDGRTVDKMPGNYRRLGAIRKMFPQAAFVWSRRDWRDNVLSLFFGDFSSQHQYAYNLHHAVHCYRTHLGYMEHWKSIDVPVYEHHYESAIEDLESAAAALLAALGEEFEERCLAFHESERTVTTMSWQQVRRPLYKTSRGRWRRYEAGLREVLGDVIDDEDLDAL